MREEKLWDMTFVELLHLSSLLIYIETDIEI